MQIALLIIPVITVNVVDDLPWLCAYDLSVFPLATPSWFWQASFCAYASTVLGLVIMPVGFFCSCACGGTHGNHRVWGVFNFITFLQRAAGRQPAFLGLIRIQRVAVFPIHLVMAGTHFCGKHWPTTVRAWSPDDLAAPSVFGRSVSSNALVVHQAKPMCRMFPATVFNRTRFHNERGIIAALDKLAGNPRYKALGNSWAVPVVAWIAARIDAALAGGAP